MQYTTISDVQDLPASAVVDIYGAGGSGAVLLEAVQSQRPDCRIERFIDGMKGPGEFNGLPVVRADAVSPEEYGQKCLVVASVYFQEILQRLGQAGFSRAFVYRPEEAPIKRGYLALPVLASVSVENGSLRVVHNGSELPKGVSLAGVVLGPEQGTEEHRLLEQELVGICERAGAMCEFVADAPAISASEFIFPTPQDCTLVYDCRAETALVYFTIQALLAANPGKPVLYMKRNKPFVAEALEVPQKKLVYVVVPKCGTTSMLHHLRTLFEEGFTSDMLGYQNTTLPTLFRDYTNEAGAFAGHCIFSVVRNPFSRVASIYHYFESKGLLGTGYVFPFMLQYGYLDTSFRSFCEMVCTIAVRLSDKLQLPRMQ